MKFSLYKMLGLAFGAALGTSAMAAPIALPSGPIYVQFGNLEQVGAVNPGYAPLTVGAGATVSGSEFNWGVFNVTSIQRGAVSTDHVDIGSGNGFFFNDGPGGSFGQVHGIFYGVQATASPLRATGGYIDFYYTEAGSETITPEDMAGGFAPSERENWNIAGKFTEGTLLARLKFESGIIDGDSTTTIASDIDPLTATGNGQADVYASVLDVNGDAKIDAADGAWAATLNSDWFFVDTDGDGVRGEDGETRDLRFSTRFSNLNSWDRDGVQGLISNDPARAFAVPEPASMALLGIGLLGAGLVRRRKSA